MPRLNPETQREQLWCATAQLAVTILRPINQLNSIFLVHSR